MATQTYNANPTLFAPSSQSFRKNNADTLWLKHSDTDSEEDEDESPIDAQEVFDLLRSINDPEHPLTLEELKVLSRDQVTVEGNHVTVEFTPTTPACGMANVIGLAIMVRLYRSLPQRYKVRIGMTPGSHQHVAQVTKQLNDKERVAAAMEVDAIMESINNCLSTAGRRGEK
ncbi:hypothetical protein M407DRAFT_242682 [Tulasnella calospora MUT 4182]|uniref:MIP18 family-like domain-containing protein n=1 Tax=Tulasnella calospora MUT 4182 TaxID=1051891 RepID=A0A0C3QN14_9AGAM|nr:hypothetical protein M407DRAFT_242682 [Tulasnella calospora MUT 4182]